MILSPFRFYPFSGFAAANVNAKPLPMNCGRRLYATGTI
jgi:hypothetical protein